jgi:alanyl aminopeptidase
MSFLASPAFAAAPAKTPGMRLPDSVTPKHYFAELTVDPDRDRFSGTVKIDVVLSEAAPVIWLNGEDLKITRASIEAGGRTQAAHTTLVGKDLIKMQPAHAIPAGVATLVLEYSGKMSAVETEGIFRQKEGGDWYAETQFEAISARRAFPCFDEPHWKTPWQVALTVKAGDGAFSNTPVLEEQPVADGMKRVLFAETAPLPSYLIAFGVGPFGVLDGGTTGMRHTPLRYLTPKGRAQEARFAREATPGVVDALEKYFGIPYPYPKLDSVVVPVTVGFGAMENVGFITYAGRLITARPEQESDRFKQNYVAVSAHEIAHQWFGDLVTAAWWNDIWLNESFATWMSSKIVDELHPEWQWGVARVMDRQRAMNIDRLASTRIIRQPVNTRDDLGNAFDRITYEKGAAVLDMFENYMGETKFRDGVRRYLVAHAFDAAAAPDFLAALSTDDAAIAQSFSAFIEQPGFPRVEAELQCTGAPSLKLSQRRSLPLGSQLQPAGSWQIPVCVRYAPTGGKIERACFMLQSAQATFALPNAQSCPAWVQANAGGSGYYRAVYDGDLLTRLLANGVAAQSPAEIVATLHDAMAGAQSGDVAMAQVLELARRFANGFGRSASEASLDIMYRAGEDLVADADRPREARLVQQWYGKRAHELGFEVKSGDDEDARLLRTHLVPMVADQGDDAGLQEQVQRLARQWLERRDSVDASMVRAVLNVAAERGDLALFERIHDAARSTTDRRERENLLIALGSFRDAQILQSSLALVLKDEFESRDSITILNSAFEDSHTRRAALDFLEKNYDAIVKRLPPRMAARFPSWAGGFCDTTSRNEIAEFFGKRMAAEEGGKRNLAQALERIELCTAFRTQQQSSAKAFLADY